MTCERVQEAILEIGTPDAAVAEHVAGCGTCQRFFALQYALDERLTRAYTAPAVDAGFRVRIRVGIQQEKRRLFWDLASTLIAPGAGLVTSGLCALLAPEIARLALRAGLFLSAASYVGLLLFTWLTEELGEG